MRLSKPMWPITSMELRSTSLSMLTGAVVRLRMPASWPAHWEKVWKASFMRLAEKAGDTPLRTTRQWGSVGPVRTLTPPRNCSRLASQASLLLVTANQSLQLLHAAFIMHVQKEAKQAAQSVWWVLCVCAGDAMHACAGQAEDC